jgi:hypothetical protein
VLDALQPPPGGPDTARFNIGLMLFNESGAPQGGYMRQQFVPLTRANAAAFKTKIKAITIGDDKANNGPYAQALYEAYLVFAKKAPYQGTMGSKWDHTAVAGGLYVGAPGSGCGTNNIIFVSNGSPNENNTQALALLNGAGGSTQLITYPPGQVSNSDQNDWADEFSRFLRGVDVVASKDGVQSIVTHAVAVVGGSSDNLYPNFINGIATQGGGQFKKASERRRAQEIPAQHLQQHRGGEQRVRLREPADQRQCSGHIQEPGVRRQLPARQARAPALARQPQAIPDRVRPRDRSDRAG